MITSITTRAPGHFVFRGRNDGERWQATLWTVSGLAGTLGRSPSWVRRRIKRFSLSPALTHGPLRLWELDSKRLLQRARGR